MPTRPVVALIVAFWLATLALVGVRDVWPRLAASGPPPIAADLSDEATQYVPVKWKVLRGDKPIGTLTTLLAYQDSDDTFEFTSKYKDVRIEVARVELVIPEMTTRTRVTRSGSLREQSMNGSLRLADFRFEVMVDGRNVNGAFSGRCKLDSPLGMIDEPLAPVPVNDGHALNPLQPVNRIVGIRAGQRWTVQEIDPLGDALATLFKEKIRTALPQTKREPLLAEVGASPEPLIWGRQREEAMCWVIAYRSGEARARTWVRVSDGKVLRQEAVLMEDRIALERDE
ncbi:MAG: hypothetical protein U0791_15365 [Gemmataceae bacterium]